MTAVDFRLVATLHWNGELGAKLEKLRKRRGFSRKSLSERTEAMGRKISQAYIQQLESPHLFTGKEKKPQALTVSAEIIQHLCVAMEVDITLLLRSAKIFLPIP